VDSSTRGHAVHVTDPSGLDLRLLEAPEDVRAPWPGSGVPADFAIRGLHSVTLTVEATGPSMAFASELLGFQVVDEAAGLVRLAVNGDLPGHRLELKLANGAPRAQNGLGTVHHVAFAAAGKDEQVRLRQELLARGYSVTGVLDRQYFQSIYFREPGGILFEVATVEPGFAVDETPDQLGRELKLPPWEEPNRAEIERALPPILSTVS